MKWKNPATSPVRETAQSEKHVPILFSAYMAPVQYYAHLYACGGRAIEDRGEHFVKQTYRNRCLIATPDGPMALTVPIMRDNASHTPMSQIRLSDHGNWRHLHWNALQSAYDNSPYFIYYADELREVFDKPFTFLADFNEAIENLFLDFLSIPRRIKVSHDYISSPRPCALDLRQAILPKATAGSDPLFRPAPYYQVFRARTGFLPNLSIADLLFNLGPESRMVLRESITAPQMGEK